MLYILDDNSGGLISDLDIARCYNIISEENVSIWEIIAEFSYSENVSSGRNSETEIET